VSSLLYTLNKTTLFGRILKEVGKTQRKRNRKKAETEREGRKEENERNERDRNVKTKKEW
jgi:hypothetical protein